MRLNSSLEPVGAETKASIDYNLAAGPSTRLHRARLQITIPSCEPTEKLRQESLLELLERFLVCIDATDRNSMPKRKIYTFHDCSLRILYLICLSMST